MAQKLAIQQKNALPQKNPHKTTLKSGHSLLCLLEKAK
jgi:hypothetical protein